MDPTGLPAVLLHRRDATVALHLEGTVVALTPRPEGHDQTRYQHRPGTRQRCEQHALRMGRYQLRDAPVRLGDVVAHARLQTTVNDYALLLQLMGRSAEDVRDTLRTLAQRYGLDLGGSGGQASEERSQKLKAIVERLRRDPLKGLEIITQLQRDDPALLMELMKWIQSQKGM
jgi:hypothetical protein